MKKRRCLLTPGHQSTEKRFSGGRGAVDPGADMCESALLPTAPPGLLLGTVTVAADPKASPLHSLRRRHAWGAAGERGAEALEAALAFALLLTLLLGIFWVGRAYNVYESITRAAREGARFAVAPSCATCGDAMPAPAAVEAVVNASLAASTLNPQGKTSYLFQQNVTLNPQSAAPEKELGVVVSFSYPVTLYIPFTSLSASTVSISTQVQMRQENQ